MSTQSNTISPSISKRFNGKMVQLHPDKEHQFLMDMQQTAKGFGCSLSTIKTHKRDHADELIEGKHFLRVGNPDSRGIVKTQGKIYFTKRGIIRLGFFLRSEMAKKFRDWAEDLVIEKMENRRPEKLAQDKTKEAMVVEKTLETYIAENQSRLIILKEINEMIIEMDMQELRQLHRKARVYLLASLPDEKKYEFWKRYPKG